VNVPSTAQRAIDREELSRKPPADVAGNSRGTESATVIDYVRFLTRYVFRLHHQSFPPDRQSRSSWTELR
jgi:hypothetical protein